MAESKKYAKMPESAQEYHKIVVLLRRIVKDEEHKAAAMFCVNPDIIPYECLNRIAKIQKLNNLGARTESIPKLDKEDILHST